MFMYSPLSFCVITQPVFEISKIGKLFSHEGRNTIQKIMEFEKTGSLKRSW